MSPFTGP